MAGNSQRRGARRTQGSKKGQTSGTGGQGRRRLQGKGPTPKAQDRTGHPAARRARAAERGKASSRRAASTAASSRGRDGDGPEVVAGRNAVVEALRASVPATALYVAERIDSDDRVKEALRLAVDGGVPVLEGPRPELDRLTAGAIHQGLVLQVPPYSYAHPDDLLAREGRTPLIVALDGVTDPRNLGAVVRSTAAFNGTGVVIPQRRAAGLSVGAWKASAGAAARLRVAKATNLPRTLDSYKDAGLFVVGLDADGDVALPDLEAAIDPLVLVVGSEGKGLSRLVARSCDLLVRIPIDSATESLNAGVAAGVALYEISRRRAAP
jgi:23S rRNA (guanosine2251-2'-O)-methyltransferase